MATTITPNMNLIVPTPGQEPGPTYATDINSSLTLIDQHNHSPGQGVPITPSGLNISTDLSFLANNATNLRSVRFSPQNSSLIGATDLGCLYEQGVDLYYNDGNGNVVRITQGGSVAGASGSITGLASPASVVFSSLTGTFTFQSDTNVAGKLDIGPLTIRDTAASALGISLVSPVGLSGAYTLTLPASLPGANLPLSVDNSGNLSAALVTGSQIDSATIDGTNLVSDIALPGSNVTAGGRQVVTGRATSSPIGLTIVRGRLASNSTILSGEGFSGLVTNLGGGVFEYAISFNIPFTNVPAVNVTWEGTTGLSPYIFVLNTGGFTCRTVSSITPVLNFIAIGA